MEDVATEACSQDSVECVVKFESEVEEGLMTQKNKRKEAGSYISWSPFTGVASAAYDIDVP